MAKIREERPDDIETVRRINDAAFGQTQEGLIVDALRQSCEDTLSLIASLEGAVVGHIQFSRVMVHSGARIIPGMGLAPMAVWPQFQNRGIGSRLVREGIKRIREKGYPFIAVLGHDHFYPRFGFDRASKFGLFPQWEEIPDTAFMALILDQGAMEPVSGIVRYDAVFDTVI
jgi:putative acetyltransferase